MRKIIFVFATAMACTPGASWKIIGPGGGGAQYFPTISPHDPKRVLVACDMTGSYITEDAGATWRMFNLGGVTKQFVWDPKDSRSIYAVNKGLYHSNDGGRSWRLLYPQPGPKLSVDMANDHADESFVVDGKPAKRLTALAVDPSDSKVLYAGIGTSFALSRDAGVTWQTGREFAGPLQKIWATGDAGYAATDRLVSSRDASGSWHDGEPVAEDWSDISAGPPVIYAVSESKGRVSDDDGKTWRSFELPGAGAKLHAVATSRLHSDVAYVSYEGLKLDGQIWFGVAKTTDRGRTWQLVWKENAQRAAENVHDAWITARFDPAWGDYPLTIGASDNDPDLVYATDLGRTMRTTNGGKTWEAVYSHKSGSGWVSNGLDVTTSYGVHVDPFNAKRVFLTLTDIGAFRSEDGGRSWLSTTAGVPRPWINTTYWMVFDPEVRGRVWGVASGTHDLPRPKMWRRTSPQRYKGGVIVSDDGGVNWRASNKGMPETAPTHIILDPKSPKNARVLYVAAMGRGVFKSADGGATWTPKNNGIAGEEPFAWRLSMDRNGGLYVVIARRSEDGSIGNSGDGALYYSSDGAEHWTRLPLPAGVNGPNAVTVDTRDPQRLYLSAWQRRGPGTERTGGVFLSADAGKTWRRVLTRDEHIYDVTVDPRDPATLYACGFESSAWRSADRGETWERIQGYDFKWGHRVMVDPSNPGMIYITTFGGGLWHGPAAGDHSAMR